MISLYLIISTMVGVSSILSYNRWCNYMVEVPRGDLEFYERKNLISTINYVFFPSLLVIILYIAFVKCVNIFVQD